MAHFYVTAGGSADTEASRCGTPSSGVRAHPRGWDVGVLVWGEQADGCDQFHVQLTAGSHDDRDDVPFAAVRREDQGWTVTLTRPDGTRETLHYRKGT